MLVIQHHFLKTVPSFPDNLWIIQPTSHSPTVRNFWFRNYFFRWNSQENLREYWPPGSICSHCSQVSRKTDKSSNGLMRMLEMWIVPREFQEWTLKVLLYRKTFLRILSNYSHYNGSSRILHWPCKVWLQSYIHLYYSRKTSSWFLLLRLR